MITSSWFWKCLLLVVGVMAAHGKAQDNPIYDVTFDTPISLALNTTRTVNFTSTGEGTVEGINIILLQWNAPNLVKVLDVETGRQRFHENLKLSSTVSSNIT